MTTTISASATAATTARSSRRCSRIVVVSTRSSTDQSAYVVATPW
jgi:hypothetical protein